MQSWLFLLALFVPTALTSLARAEPCEVEGVISLRDLHVRVGRSEFVMVADDAHVAARPPTRGPMHEVEVRSSLGFVAQTETLPYVIRERLETGHGMVSLMRDARIDHVRPDGDDLTLTVHFHGASITGLRAGCGEIVLGREASLPAERLQPMRVDQTLWRPRVTRLLLHARPGAGPTVVMRFGRDRLFSFRRVEWQGAWMKVVWSDGYNRVVGWVRGLELRPSGMIGWGSTGGSGSASCAAAGRVSGDRMYQGPATLTPGAWVRDAPQGQPWASVRQAEGFIVVQREGEAWTQILVAPNVEEIGSCSLRHAWIRSSEVTLPDGARTPPGSTPGAVAPGSRGADPRAD